MEDTRNLDHVRLKDRLEFIDCDLLDAHSIRRAVEISKPEKVFHFAAQSFPEVSFKTPVITLQTNTVGTTHLLEAIKESDYDPVIVSVSTSEVYGMPNEDEVPIKETNPIRAANPYSISKVGHDLMSQYFISYLPVQVLPEDLLIISALSIGAALLASLYPAWRAMGLMPSRVLANE